MSNQIIIDRVSDFITLQTLLESVPLRVTKKDDRSEYVRVVIEGVKESFDKFLSYYEGSVYFTPYNKELKKYLKSLLLSIKEGYKTKDWVCKCKTNLLVKKANKSDIFSILQSIYCLGDSTKFEGDLSEDEKIHLYSISEDLLNVLTWDLNTSIDSLTENLKKMYGVCKLWTGGGEDYRIGEVPLFFDVSLERYGVLNKILYMFYRWAYSEEDIYIICNNLQKLKET